MTDDKLKIEFNGPYSDFRHPEAKLHVTGNQFKISEIEPDTAMECTAQGDILIGSRTLQKSRLSMVGMKLVFRIPRKKPNAWWRVWQYLFFGFTWEDAE